MPQINNIKQQILRLERNTSQKCKFRNVSFLRDKALNIDFFFQHMKTFKLNFTCRRPDIYEVSNRPVAEICIFKLIIMKINKYLSI